MPSPCHCSASMISTALAAKAMKKDLHKDYAALCSVATVPATSEYLFGDLSKLTKDISEANKLTKKVHPPQRNTARNQARNGNSGWNGRHYSYTNQGTQGNRRFQAYQRTRNDFFVQRPPSKDKIEEGGRIKTGLMQTSSSTTKVCKVLRCNPAINLN